jgi:hypothetical protein
MHPLPDVVEVQGAIFSRDKEGVYRQRTCNCTPQSGIMLMCNPPLCGKCRLPDKNGFFKR